MYNNKKREFIKERKSGSLKKHIKYYQKEKKINNRIIEKTKNKTKIKWMITKNQTRIKWMI